MMRNNISLQNVIFDSEFCDTQELFFRGDAEVVSQNEVLIRKDSWISTDTYMNIYDSVTWRKYTDISQCCLEMFAKGTGELRLMYCEKGTHTIIDRKSIDSEATVWLQFDLPSEKMEGYYYFEAKAKNELRIRNARFFSPETIINKVSLGIIICTYKREDYIERNIKQLKQSQFFDSESLLYHKLKIIVVDNNSDIQIENRKYLKIFHNENTGGSGGFTRGIRELRKSRSEEDITHVIFMDDDVDFLNESLYRIFALYAYASDEFYQAVIAGRMFRMDDRKIQFTAADIWNKGVIQHIGNNVDMTKKEQLTNVNDVGKAEYGGWWMCSFPMSFVQDNDPLPFFIHCDDVEYGLRYGVKPIILNGIHAWHETYEKRKNPQIAYYDIRNSSIVNTMYGYFNTAFECMKYCMVSVISYHRINEYEMECMAIQGIEDFLNCKKVFMDHGKLKEKHGKNQNKKRRYIEWNILALRIMINFKKVTRYYEGRNTNV